MTDTSALDPSITFTAWGERSNTLAYLPGKSTDQLTTLRNVFRQLPVRSNDILVLTTAKGVERSYSAQSICSTQLNGSGLVRRQDDTWLPADALNHWAQSSDNDYLAQYLHSKVKLFGELLEILTERTDRREILESVTTYGLSWSSSDQVYRRLAWLQSLGLAERWGFSKLVVTERGKKFLARVPLETPESISKLHLPPTEDSVDLPAPGEVVEAPLRGLDSITLPARRGIIGYIPRGRKAAPESDSDSSNSTLDAIRRFVDLVGDGCSEDQLFQRAVEELGQKKSSFKQSMHTFRNMGMIEMIAFGRYGTTPEANVLLEVGNEVNFVRHMHCTYRCFAEILEHIGQDGTVSGLASTASREYPDLRLDNQEIRTRLTLLADAGLVERVDWTRYRATAAGAVFLQQTQTEILRSATVHEPAGDTIVTDSLTGPTLEVEKVLEDLRKFSRVSDASEDFERSVARAFGLLGFWAEHLGGPGKTDVLVTTELPTAEQFRSIVDAKASATGVIGDNAIKFDALKDHQKKHEADFGLIVGPEFSPRVTEWAANNNIALLTVEELINVIQRHRRSPLSTIELKGIFDRSNSSLSALEDRFDEADHSAALLARIVAMLAEEADEEDPVANGYINRENLYYVLRKELNPRPSKVSIDVMLNLLTSPHVRAVTQEGEKFKLADSPRNVALRFLSLGEHLRLSLIS